MPPATPKGRAAPARGGDSSKGLIATGVYAIFTTALLVLVVGRSATTSVCEPSSSTLIAAGGWSTRLGGGGSSLRALDGRSAMAEGPSASPSPVSDAPVAAAASCTATAAVAVSQPQYQQQLPPRRSGPWATQQLCHRMGDGSELCVYDGPLCVDTEDWTVYVGVDTDYSAWGAQSAAGAAANFSAREPLAFAGDSADSELDLRYGLYVASPLGKEARNPRLLPDEYADAAARDPVAFAQAGSVHPAALGYRRWGPTARFLTVREVPWQALAAATAPADAAALGADWAAAAATVAASRDDAVYLADLRSKGQRRIFDWRGEQAESPSRLELPDKLTWLPGAGWLMQASHNWLGHPWHFATAAFQLWAAKQANATVYAPPPSTDRLGGHSPGFRLQTGGHAFPPIDTVVFAGDYDKRRGDARQPGALSAWVRALWPILAQAHTRVLLNGNLVNASQLGVGGGGHWACFKRSVLSSIKWRLFSSVHDAHAFRLAAYALANVSAPSMAGYPPRRILILDRGVRGIANVSGLIADVAAWSGLPVERLIDGRMLHLSVEARVALFAGVGILVSPHGGQLANIMFMRPKAVVIELLPFLTHGAMYRELAKPLDLQYYQVKTLKRPEPAEAADLEPAEGRHCGWVVFDAEYIANCDNAANRSNTIVSVPLAAGSSRRCAAGKDTYARPDPGGLRYAIHSALDDIGCREGVCHDLATDQHVDMRAQRRRELEEEQQRKAAAG